MSLGGKYVFATVMCLVLPMCILNSCISVLLVLGMFCESYVALDECDEPLLVCVPCLCVWCCSEVVFVF